MEFDYKTERPLVRIGSLQSEERIHFTTHSAFDAVDLSGNMIMSGKAGETFEVTIGKSKPAEIKPMIRLAIAYHHEEAEQQVKKWEKEGLNIQLIRVGENSQISKNETIDNREYWILASGFSTRDEAEKQRRELDDFGSYQLFMIPEKPAEGTLMLQGQEVQSGFRLIPQDNNPLPFTLHDVRVGIGFHWDHREDQRMENILEFQIDKKGLITAINVLDIENYLASVNSSEMVAECSLEFLKAQTTVARCTVFATANKHHYGDPFDLCADDHCQCFHGSGAIQARSIRAAKETEGQVLLFDQRICDTRYAKVCGGIGETYRNVWDDRHLPYLDQFYDGPDQRDSYQPVDSEDKIRPFIASSPPVFCNPEKHKMPAYLDYAEQYFRWQITYSPEELGKIVAEKHANLGPILDILPLKRGSSGRLIYVKLVGENGEATIGKELEIRRVLSKSHLYSSCFYVDKKTGVDGKTTQLTVHGAGWGHGVGLCQVGAAVMGEEGYTDQQILKHYYDAAELKKIY